jgi:hypothetical protein
MINCEFHVEYLFLCYFVYGIYSFRKAVKGRELKHTVHVKYSEILF